MSNLIIIRLTNRLLPSKQENEIYVFQDSVYNKQKKSILNFNYDFIFILIDSTSQKQSEKPISLHFRFRTHALPFHVYPGLHSHLVCMILLPVEYGILEQSIS